MYYELLVQLKVYYKKQIMFSKLIFATFFLSNFANASSPSMALSEQQEKNIVDRLNDVCADSWCEGPFNILFTSLKYDKDSGQEFYSVRLNAENTYASTHTVKNVDCRIDDVELIQNIVKTTDQKTLRASETRLYNLVDECLAKNLTVQDMQN